MLWEDKTVTVFTIVPDYDQVCNINTSDDISPLMAETGEDIKYLVLLLTIIHVHVARSIVRGF
jgi:hypothetical protein